MAKSTASLLCWKHQLFRELSDFTHFRLTLNLVHPCCTAGESLHQGMCKCAMHLLSHHAPTGAWYFVYTNDYSIVIFSILVQYAPLQVHTLVDYIMRTHIVWVHRYCTVSNTCTACPYTNRHQSSSVYCAIDRCEQSLCNRDSNQRG